MAPTGSLKPRATDAPRRLPRARSTSRYQTWRRRLLRMLMWRRSTRPSLCTAALRASPRTRRVRRIRRCYGRSPRPRSPRRPRSSPTQASPFSTTSSLRTSSTRCAILCSARPSSRGPTCKATSGRFCPTASGRRLWCTLCVTRSETLCPSSLEMPTSAKRGRTSTRDEPTTPRTCRIRAASTPTPTTPTSRRMCGSLRMRRISRPGSAASSSTTHVLPAIGRSARRTTTRARSRPFCTNITIITMSIIIIGESQKAAMRSNRPGSGLLKAARRRSCRTSATG
mmetsp:Transcript_2907/g.11055  ORF Transcript_2907/g.11055 Transcript_2907/m.11055 type:complete len:283 (+) Transcript_2907:202-1050(+)